MKKCTPYQVGSAAGPEVIQANGFRPRDRYMVEEGSHSILAPIRQAVQGADMEAVH